jgi:hypothetical protein
MRIFLNGAALSALLFMGCGTKTEAASPSCAPSDAIVVASDYVSSRVGSISLDGTANLAWSGVDLGGDPILAVSRGRAFFIARDKDLIFELDPACGEPRAKIDVHDPKRQGTTNAQDVAVAPDGTWWVPRFNEPSITVMNDHGSVTSTIDLSMDDPDGNPNASAIQIVEVGGISKAFVALERLDDHDQLKSKLPSWMLRIDLASGAIDHLELAGRDPFGTMNAAGGFLYLATPGNFDAADEVDAGVERFDPATFTSKLLATERDLGGSVAEVAISEKCGAAIVADPTTNVNRTSVVIFDPQSGQAIAKNVFGPTEGFDLSSLAWRGNLLLIADRRRAADGYPIHVLEATDACALTPRPDKIFVSQKPVAVRVL